MLKQIFLDMGSLLRGICCKTLIKRDLATGFIHFEHRVTINIPQETVFQFFSDESGFKNWLPFFYGDVLLTQESDGTLIRTMILFGKVYRERVFRDFAPDSLTFEIVDDSKHPFSNHQGSFEARVLSSSQTELVWRDQFIPKRSLIGGIAPFGMRWISRSGIQRAKTLLEETDV